MIRRFISYYKPYKKIFILDMIASFFIACLRNGLSYNHKGDVKQTCSRKKL